MKATFVSLSCLLLATLSGVLQPARAADCYGWGWNNFGQIGDGTSEQRLTPSPVVTSGALAGKSITLMQGSNHTALALASDGKLYAWGGIAGAGGALGNGTVMGSPEPVAVDMSGVLAGKTITDVSVGNDHSLVLTSEGKVYAWGDTYFGAVGNGEMYQDSPLTFPDPELVPVEVIATGALAGKTVTKISAGGPFSLALTSEGKIYGWGRNFGYELGTGSQGISAEPVAVNMNGELSGKTVTDISAGQSHSLAVTTEGKVYGWGSGSWGTLGTGSTASASSPVLITMDGALAGKTVAKVSAGVLTSMALTSDGKVYAWGRNDHGQLGDGTTTDRYEPVAVDMSGALAGKTVTDIVAGLDFHLMLTSDGKVYACGQNEHGQLGDGSTTDSHTPVAVNMTGPLDRKIATAISINSFGGYLLAAQDPAPYLQVFNGVGAGGSQRTDNQSTVHFSNLPLHSQELRPFTIRNDGQLPLEGLTVTASGADAEQFEVLGLTATTLGAGETAVFHVRFSPTSSGAKNAMVSVTSTSSGAFANPFRIPVDGSGATEMDWDGYGWMGNTFGQIGDGSTLSRTSAVHVDKTGVLAGRFLRDLDAGSYHTVAVDQDGLVYAWGVNDVGQLGSGNQVDSASPVAVLTSGALAGKFVTTVSVGGKHCLALTSEGKVYAWGDNGQGQLGIGSYLFQTQPVAVGAGGLVDGKTVIKIEAGTHHSFAVTSDGKLYAWGYNSNGRLGTGGGAFYNTPAEVTGALAGKFIDLISAGDEHTIVTTTDDLCYAWGDNSTGAFGDGTLTSSNTPVLVDLSAIPQPSSGNRVSQLSAGYGYTAVLAAGKAYAWGANESGQLGDGTKSQRTSPVAVDVSSALAGKLLGSITAGQGVTMATSASGTEYFGWGALAEGQSGGLMFNRLSPVAGDMSGQLHGKMISRIDIGGEHLVALAHGALPVEADIAVSQSPGKALVSGSVCSWGTQAVGSSQEISFDISNVGTGAMAGLTVTKAGLDLGLFAITTPPSTSVTAGGSTSLTVTFTPDSEGTKTAALYLTSNDPDQTTFEIILTGNGGAPSGSAFLGWGVNESGRIGDGTTTDRAEPVAIDQSGALWGQTIAEVEDGWGHTLVRTGDGKLFAWGANIYGELGNSTSTFSNVAVPVDMHRALLGHTVTAISAGNAASAALTGDGKIFMWGNGAYGQLGHGGFFPANTPYPVDDSGVLAGKTMTAVSVGDGFTLALASGGELYAWGLNNAGQLGTGAAGPSEASPVAVDMSGALAGKTITAISAWNERSLALTSEGRVYAWGSNGQGALGDGTTTDRAAPVGVDVTGVLAGKTVTAISCGYSHALAVTSEGEVYAWGANTSGQLGDATANSSSSPVMVDMSGALAGKTVVKIRAGLRHSLAVTSDGRLYAWGYLPSGLGDGSTVLSLTPVEITGNGALSGRLVTGIGSKLEHVHVLTGPAPALPTITGPTIGEVTDDTAVLGGDVISQGDALVTERGIVFSSLSVSENPRIGAEGVTRIVVSGTTGAFNTTAAGLQPNTTYAVAAYATSSIGTVYTGVDFFTTATILEGWRQTYFPGSTSTDGPGADDATPQGDDIPNLVKFALGMDPSKPGVLPVTFDGDGEVLSYTYTPSVQAVAAGIQFRVEFSIDLSEFSWSWEIVNQGEIGSGGVPVTATVAKPEMGKGYLRLRVMEPQ
ncbi:RCC1 domain-containing protein [Luteolibacter soli]|uniref:Choice-of-anchor D domain-containing protein n=1 Tax=Luteolibacter soli TaxID=3135280 RepID=A0ABU9B2A1_9BACT